MASTLSVMSLMSRVPLAFTVVSVLVKVVPLRYQVMVGEGSPEAVQLRVSELNDLEKLVGQTVTFRCVVDGISTPTVAWYHNGGNPRGVTPVSGSNRDVNSLTISSSVARDTGMYQCIANNGVGKNQALWALHVRKPG